MRKLIALGLTVVAVTSVVSGAALAGKKKSASQHVEASVLVPQGGNAAVTCVYRVQRALYIAMGEQANGVFGYTFKVDPKTAGLPFELSASEGAGFDISFYGDLGSDPSADAPANMAYETPGPGGEKGVVPSGYPNGMVCLTEGANASFTYKAGK